MAEDSNPLTFFENLLDDDVLIKDIVEKNLTYFDYQYTLNTHDGTYTFFDSDEDQIRILYLSDLIESTLIKERSNTIEIIKKEFIKNSSIESNTVKILKYYFHKINQLINSNKEKLKLYPSIYKQLEKIVHEINIMLEVNGEKQLKLDFKLEKIKGITDSKINFKIDVDNFFLFLKTAETINDDDYEILKDNIFSFYISREINKTTRKIAFKRITQKELSFSFYVFNLACSQESFSHSMLAEFLINTISNFKKYSNSSLEKIMGSTSGIKWKDFIPTNIKDFNKHR